MKQIRNRLTYANVMSSIAVFLVLGGATAFAAGQLGKNSVGSKQLKKNAVTSAKIKKNAVTGAKIKNGVVNGAKVQDGSLTGADINLGTLGTVPKASDSDTVAGSTIRLINFVAEPVTGPTQILNLDGFTLTASCEAGDTTVVLANGPSGSRIQSVSTETSGTEPKNTNATFDDTLEPNSNVNLLSDDDDLEAGHTEFSLGSGGRAVSVVWESEGFASSSGPNCTFTGYAIG